MSQIRPPTEELYVGVILMSVPNSTNTAKGKSFQEIAAVILAKHFGIVFQTEYPIPIGDPPKAHRFDLVSDDQKYIAECKSHAWTKSHNVPSAKIASTNEAVFYLQHLPKGTHHFVVMKKDYDAKHNETLAEYYFRTNKHLLSGIFVVEIDTETETVREFRA